MKNLYKLFQVLHKWKPLYGLAGLLLILSTCARMLEPKILQIAIDGVILVFQSGGEELPNSNDTVAQWIYGLLPALTFSNLTWLLVCLGSMYVIISFVRGAAMFTSSVLTSHSTEKAIKRLRDNIFDHLQGLPLTFHSQNTTGELIQRCTGDVDTVRKFILNQVVDVILMSSIFILSFAMMAAVHLTYALIAITLVPFIMLTSYLFFKKESKIWEEHEAEQDKLTSIVEENLSGIRVVQAFAREDYEIEKFDKQNEAKLAIGKRHAMLHALFWPLSDILIHVQIAMSIFAGGYFALTGQITVGELTSFYTYAIMVTWPMRRLGRVVSQMSMALVAIDRLSTILDEQKENYEGFVLDGKPLKGDVEFRNVWFKYKEEDEEFVLKNISFTAKSGEKIALMGATGSGKSTIIALLTRFFEPTKGEIFIDGVNIKEFSKAYLRKQIGVVLQKAFLFSTTIKNNIAYANPTAHEDDIIQSAKAACIHEIMDIFPKGYDTMVGEKGVTLSGGQKQRVALARTLLESPDILVLDDATSAVDTETEYYIQQALNTQMQNITTFIIAHRISAVQHAQKIIVLDKGSIVEMGSHEELVQEGGFYQQVYEVQAAMDLEVL